MFDQAANRARAAAESTRVAGRPARPADPAIAAEAMAGLTAQPKTLPPKLFYDDEGCRLFGRITELPEYYVTRTELVLLDRIAPEVAGAAPPGCALVEYGASDEGKAALLLRRLRAPACYVPVDVAAPALEAVRARMRQSYPSLPVYPVAADFMRTVHLPLAIGAAPRLGFFPGSTIGNLDPDAARDFLRRAADALGPDALFLVGVDLRKSPDILVPAYDDAAGVTAAFNRNLLVRLNREADADFDLGAFAHRAVWNEEASRIEMHLVSLREQVVHLAGQPIRFARGEIIHTENSYKHTPAGFLDLARGAGWQGERMWTDPDGLFSIHLLRRSGSARAAAFPAGGTR